MSQDYKREARWLRRNLRAGEHMQVNARLFVIMCASCNLITQSGH